MLGVEWSTEVGENFTENLPRITEKEPNETMFHGTIDLIGSSDDDYESDLNKTEDDVSSKNVVSWPHVDEEVRNVVGDIVDFVERSMMFPEFGYDPDDLVKQENIELREGSCMKPHCQRGCLCSSLRGAFQHVPTHCSKERCMFECHCQERGLSAIDDESHYADKSKRKKKIPNRFKDVVLGRAYKKLHARTIHDASHPEESNSDSDYETSALPSFKKTSPVSSPPKVPSPEPKKDANGLAQTKNDNSWILGDKIANIKRTIQERRVGFVANTISEDQTLADVNIWCSQHNKYSCLCINYVYFSKTNYLLWKPSNKSRYLANKVAFEILLKEPSQNEIPYEVFPYDRNAYCARTYGKLLEYGIRNKDEVFESKRKMELEHNVLTYSNSYVKFKNFLLVKASEPVPSAEPYNKCGRKRSRGKLVKIVKTAEKKKVDVGEELLNVKVNYQLDYVNSEDEEAKAKVTVSGRKRKLTQKMKELEEERKREREAELEDMKRIQEEIRLRQAKEEAPVKVPKRRGRPPKPKPEVPPSAVKPLENRRLSEDRPIRQPTPEVQLIPFKKNGLRYIMEEEKKEEEVRIKQEPDSPDYFSAESRMDMENEPQEESFTPDLSQEFKADQNHNGPSSKTAAATAVRKTRSPKVSSKAVKDCLEKEFREDTPKPFLGFSDCDDNSEAEDGESDLVDSVHSKKVFILTPRTDGYPHLGLLCLTPGVGYLSVTESLRGRVVIVDPITPTIRHTFDSIRSANDCLNRFFRSKVSFSTPDLILQWILVTPGILKLKQAKPVNPEIFHNTSMVITRNGPVRFAPTHRKNLNLATNCSLLRKQLSEHSVFRPLIKKQLAMRETERAEDFLHNTKVTTDESRWVPNPKFGRRKPTNRLRPIIEQRFQSSDSLVSLERMQNVSMDTPEGCVTFHRMSDFESNLDNTWTPTRPPLQFTPIDQSGPVHPQLTPIDQSGRIHPQVTLRPLPNLTKILSSKLAAKLCPNKRDW